MNGDVRPADADTAIDVAVAAADLTLTYGATIAVRDATFTVPRGATTAIIGPNGSGKTTLLRAISGLQEPASGQIEVFGAPPERRRRTVAHVMQTNTVNEAVPLTVVEVVRMGRYSTLGTIGRFRDRDHEAVADAMRRMEIVDLAGRQLRDLSGGQRQRVFVAQGLAQQADLLLLDEPITGLDIPSQERIDRALEEEVAAGRTVVLTTHHVTTAAAADHVLLMATHVVASGPPEDVLAEEHLEHAYGATTFRTAEGTLVIGDPHVHGTDVTGHDEH
ncbi:MAG: metal ABC transporter ATP-binding protein [Nitriliruptorales bacterium]|nr:metal ABC transporter ATP-binding protein [Nitriliruptorales bacterium]